jgi:NAD(P)H-dependent FMN reductase
VVTGISGLGINGLTKDWSAKIASLDAYVFVTPEYNHFGGAQKCH